MSIMEYPKVSIVVLNWNGAHYLQRTIASLAELDYRNKEIIVVDNGSNDESIVLLNKFSEVRVITNPKNFGYSRGKNTGVAQAAGEFVLLLDNDILVRDKAIIYKLLDYHRRLDSAGFICPVLIQSGSETTYFYKGPLGYSGVHRIKLIKNGILEKAGEQAYRTKFILGGNIFFKKEIWALLRGYDEDFPFNMDDYDISVRAHLYGFKNYMMINQPLNLHLGKTVVAEKKQLRWRYRYLLAGHLVSNLKNYRVVNFLIISFFALIRILLVTVKQAILSRDWSLLLTYPFSVCLFIARIPGTLRKRRIIQDHRVCSDYSLLSIKIKADI